MVGQSEGLVGQLANWPTSTLLKKGLSELEKTREHLNQELTSVHNQYEEKDKDYQWEKKLRIKYQNLYNSCGSSSTISSSDVESNSTDTDNDLIIRGKEDIEERKNMKGRRRSPSRHGRKDLKTGRVRSTRLIRLNRRRLGLALCPVNVKQTSHMIQVKRRRANP